MDGRRGGVRGLSIPGSEALEMEMAQDEEEDEL